MDPRSLTCNLLLLPLIVLLVLLPSCTTFHRGVDHKLIRSFSVEHEHDHHHRHIEQVNSNQQAVQGLHLALAGPQQLRVTWMTPAVWGSGPFSPICVYGETPSLKHKAQGSAYSYHAGMFKHTLNTVILDVSDIQCHSAGLVSESRCVKMVSYRCGDVHYGFSDVYHTHFHSDTAVPDKPGAKIAMVGDMGVPHGQNTINSIAARMAAGQSQSYSNNNSNNSISSSGSQPGGLGVELLLHVGDITYADVYHQKNSNNSWVWVDYMDSLQKVAAFLPYMTAPGNHEAQFDFAAYLNWLPMPNKPSGSGSPFWFSFDYLGVHVVMFSTEHPFDLLSRQYHWLQQDLEKADKNRARVPWIVVMGHRPLYCSSIVCWNRCHQEAALYRSYLESLFLRTQVDVVIAGHIHHYERSFPVYNDKSTQRDYHSPKAPVYIINGGAGNPELNDPTFEPNVEWRAWYNVTVKTGFLLMTPSRSQLAFQYVFSDSNEVVDSFTITKE